MTEHEQNALLTNLEMQLAEYKQAKAAYEIWYAVWKARQPTGFRIKNSQQPYQHVARET